MLRCVGWRCVLASASLAECRSECPSRSGPFEGPATESLRLCRRIITDRDHAGEILQQGEARERHGLDVHAFFSPQASPAASGHFKVRTWNRRDARQHWLGRCRRPRGMAAAWTRRPPQPGDPGPLWPDPGPDILWSAPEIAGMPAYIGLGDAGHPREWPWPGPGGPCRRATQDHGGRTLDRTFYGPHLKSPECPPTLAWVTPVTPENGPALDWEVPAGGRSRATVAGPRTGHSMVRTRNRRNARQHWFNRACLSPAGPPLGGHGVPDRLDFLWGS